MRAVTLREFGGPEVLRLEHLPTPRPGPAEVLIRVAAVSVGRLLDLVARSGKHPYAAFTFPHILGAEHTGIIAALGSDVQGFAIGDHVATFPVITDPDCPYVKSGYAELSPTARIIGTHTPGADADYIAVPATNVFAVPDGLDPAEAVALALAGVVAMNQFTRAGLEAGQRVVVQGASSALGSTTALLAKHLGAEVIVTSRHHVKRARLRELGFDMVLDSDSPSFVADAHAAFGGHGADLIVDNLGDPQLWDKGMSTLAPRGAMVTSGAFLGGLVQLDLRRLYTFGQRVIGVRSGDLIAAGRLWAEVRAGFRSVVDRTFSLTDAALAHEYVGSSGNVGRVALLTEPTQ
ncbi:zinc-binding dehydrogenase [Gordonia sp. TBRC 11910]|uniref:Zinc-binding dehydrogenase n=1 Tax=Gordonia asplenii TaxID=2725283 RepID=A0A848L026_9ACTN|nr:zinc-binding dehydrogenase [Gordonia asplenii]NMO01993.1 zinc-binding dehydrogenase [Gordonia asplenii]